MSKKNVSAKLLNIMAAVQNIEKKGRNTHQNYDYVRDEDVSAVIQKELIANRCLFYPDVTETIVTPQGDKVLTTLIIKWTFMDTESGEEISFTFPGQGIDKADKGSNKAATGSHKNALIKFFNIPTGGQDAELNDGEFYGSQQQPRKQYPQNKQNYSKKQQKPAAEYQSKPNVQNPAEATLKAKFQKLFGSLNDFDLFMIAAGPNTAAAADFMDRQIEVKSDYFKKILQMYNGDKERAGKFVRKNLLKFNSFKAIHDGLEASVKSEMDREINQLKNAN